MKELTGIVINPSKGRKKKRGNKKEEKRKRRVRSPRNVIILTNPSKDQEALLSIAAGAAVGLAGGKLIDRAIGGAVRLPLPVSLGDSLVLVSGLYLLKGGGKKKEFATGIVAGSGAKLLLNVIDRFVFNNKGVVSLHGSDYVEPYPEVEFPVEETEPVELNGLDTDIDIPEVIETVESEDTQQPELTTL